MERPNTNPQSQNLNQYIQKGVESQLNSPSSNAGSSAEEWSLQNKADESDNHVLPISGITTDEILAETQKLLADFEPVAPKHLLAHLLEQVEKVDFRQLTGLVSETDKLTIKHYQVVVVEQILVLARRNNWGLCQSNGNIYVYNGAYWSLIDNSELQGFLGKAAEKMGVYRYDARHFNFKEQLYKQFLTAANLVKPVRRDNVVLINLQNGTFEISAHEQKLRAHEPNDFLTYQLPFSYNSEAKAPLFKRYLNTALPDIDLQHNLSEFAGSVFINRKVLKLEKALLLYGDGANGKSVFFEILNALLGPNNVSNHSLQSLTDSSGYYRAQLADKLVNYGSELNGRMQFDLFKQMVSGEPLGARLPYKDPVTIEDYAKLIFNCNELPKEVEHNNAYFRRLLIIPFKVTIPEAEQDKELSNKIVMHELAGVFNWVIEGLQRLLQQKKFTYSDAVQKELENYRKESNSVLMFLDEEQYQSGTEVCWPLKDLYQHYRSYCLECGYRFCTLKTFSSRLKAAGYHMERKNFGQVVYLNKKNVL